MEGFSKPGDSITHNATDKNNKCACYVTSASSGVTEGFIILNSHMQTNFPRPENKIYCVKLVELPLNRQSEKGTVSVQMKADACIFTETLVTFTAWFKCDTGCERV